MIIIVMSDSHGQKWQLEEIIGKNMNADIFVHLGDGENDADAMRLRYPDIDFRFVRGNGDWSGEKSIIIEALGKKIFCTHGNAYHVDKGVEELVSAAKKNGCCAAFFGHTHRRFIGTEDGIDLMNPGSCAMPRDGMKTSYGFVKVTEQGVFMNIIDVGK